jgi:hypothetical protein
MVADFRHLLPRRFILVFLLLLMSVFAPIVGSCSENAVSVGYGFGVWNGSSPGRAEGGVLYDYATFSYLYEKPVTPRLAFILEPFCNIVNQPNDGADFGFNVYLKAYLSESGHPGRFYATVGSGAAYTTVKFEGQGTHGVFVLQGALGYRYGAFFLENRFHHYSNGGLAKPNRAVNSNIIKIGYYF